VLHGRTSAVAAIGPHRFHASLLGFSTHVPDQNAELS